MRAVAVVLVVAYHLDLPIGAGFIGVDVFFVISGFVITRLVLRRSAASGRLALRAFWAGRLRRLLPALAAMIVLTLAGAALFTSPILMQGQIAVTGLAAVLWVSNLALALLGQGYFAPAASQNPLTHTWSVSVEEQFYVFFPLLVVAALGRARRRSTVAAAVLGRWLLAVGVVSYALCVLVAFVPMPLPVGGAIAFYSPFTRGWEFVAGALVAVAAEQGWRPGRWVRWSAPMGAVGLVLSLALVEGGREFPGWIALLPVTAAVALLVGAVWGGDGVRLLESRPMVWIGDLSYSWYLYHWPPIVFLTVMVPDPPTHAVVAAGVGGFLLALASHRLVEQPIREGRRLPRWPARRLAAAVMAPTVAACAVLFTGSQQGWGKSDVQAMQQQLDHDQWQFLGVCQTPVRLDRRDLDRCRVPGDPAKEPVILVGDSNAGVYADVLVDLSSQARRTITIATVPGCSLVGLAPVDAGGRSFLDCLALYRASMQWLSTQEPSTVVVASGMSTAIDVADFGLRRPDGSVVRRWRAKERTWAKALARTYGDLAAMGHDVVQIGLIPHFPHWSPSTCPMVKILSRGASSCGTSARRTEMDRDQRGALIAERSAARATGVTSIDLRAALCPDGLCRTNDGNDWIYEDGVHLSFRAVRDLEPLLRPMLR